MINNYNNLIKNLNLRSQNLDKTSDTKQTLIENICLKTLKLNLNFTTNIIGTGIILF